MVLTKCATIFADNNWCIVTNNIITSTGKNEGSPILNYKVEQIRGFGPPPMCVQKCDRSCNGGVGGWVCVCAAVCPGGHVLRVCVCVVCVCVCVCLCVCVQKCDRSCNGRLETGEIEGTVEAAR